MLSIYAFLGPSQDVGGSLTKRGIKRARKGNNHDHEDEEPEVMPAKTTRRDRWDAAKVRAAKSKSLLKMSSKDFVRERRKNPYDTPKDRRYTTQGFHTMFQEKIFYEVLPKFKTKVVGQFCINTDYMEKHLDYFGEAIEVCKEFGIYEYIGVQEDYNEHLIM